MIALPATPQWTHEPFHDGEDGSVFCAGCGSDYTHTVATTILSRTHEMGPVTETTIMANGVSHTVPESDAHPPGEFYRDAIAITFSCEECAAISRLWVVQLSGCGAILIFQVVSTP